MRMTAMAQQVSRCDGGAMRAVRTALRALCEGDPAEACMPVVHGVALHSVLSFYAHW